MSIEQLDDFGLRLFEKKKTVVSARSSSGIETQWREDREFIAGIDNANRDTALRVSAKAAYESANGRGAVDRSSKNKSRSSVFINLTAPYVANTVAALSDMLMPIDEMPFGLEPTPIPLITEGLRSDQTIDMQGQAVPIQDVAKHMHAVAQDAADKAQSIIKDQLVECNFNAEMRKVIYDTVALGTGIMKGPFAVKRKVRKITKDASGLTALEIVSETVPASMRISLDDFYADPACGENVHNGSFTFERQWKTARELQALVGMVGPNGKSYYLDDQIRRCLQEGPDGTHKELGTKPALTDKFEMWIYYGAATKEDMDAAGCECENQSIDVMVVMVNSHVIKAELNPLDSGRFPYDVMPYQRIAGTIYGIGLPRQGRDPQRMINAVARNILDNAGVAGKPIIAIADGVESIDGTEITLGVTDLIRINPEAMVQSARDALSSVTVPMITNELIPIFQLAQKLFEDVTGTPLLMQGQQGAATDVLGGMRMLEANASATRRNIAKLFDDCIICPHITGYYEWMLLHGTDEEAKGDFMIRARGSNILFERDAANTALAQMIPLTANPDAAIDIKRLVDELCKANRIDRSKISFTDEEQAARKKAMQSAPPAGPPALEVAKLRVEGDMQREKMRQASDANELHLKADIVNAELSSKHTEAEAQRQHEMALANMELQRAIMQFANEQKISIQETNAQLAQTSQKLSVQAQLSQQDLKHKQAMVPPTEPVGRADIGRSYEQ